MATEKENRSPLNYFRSKRKGSQRKTRQHISKKERKTAVLAQRIDDEDYINLAYKPEGFHHQQRQKRRSGDTNDFKTKWKTEICHNWEVNGFCQYGDNCAFAHGAQDIRNRKMSANYKTKPCKQFFENGFCCYGSRCQFSHK